jgi:GNAT superfamily N-acetyltransferase
MHRATPADMPTLAVATEEDVTALCELAKAFIEESNYGWTYYEAAAAGRFTYHINDPESLVLIGGDNGTPAGFAIASWDRDFTREAVAYVVKFYVAPKYRGTRLARKMVDNICEWSLTNGCKHIFATNTANIEGRQDTMFSNLFSKYGFKVQGVCLAKEVNE